MQWVGCVTAGQVLFRAAVRFLAIFTELTGVFPPNFPYYLQSTCARSRLYAITRACVVGFLQYSFFLGTISNDFTRHPKMGELLLNRNNFLMACNHVKF